MNLSTAIDTSQRKLRVFCLYLCTTSSQVELGDNSPNSGTLTCATYQCSARHD